MKTRLVTFLFLAAFLAMPGTAASAQERYVGSFSPRTHGRLATYTPAPGGARSGIDVSG